MATAIFDLNPERAAEALELVDVDRDAVRRQAVAEDDGRQAARAAQVRDLLADDLASSGGERWASAGHAEQDLRTLVVGAHSTTRGRIARWLPRS